MMCVGIDPGVEGAIARIHWLGNPWPQIAVWDAPKDVFTLARLLKEAVFVWPQHNGISLVAIEDTISVPHAAKDGRRLLPASDKALHVSLGVWMGALAAREQRFTLVHPKTWKSMMLKGVANDEKAEALALERRLTWQTGLHDMLRGPKGGLKPGRVDAIFLALFAKAMRFGEKTTDGREKSSC